MTALNKHSQVKHILSIELQLKSSDRTIEYRVCLKWTYPKLIKLVYCVSYNNNWSDP